MHAVPNQLSATIQIAVRTGTDANRLAITATQGIHHASMVVCGLHSQSRELRTILLATTVIRHSRKRHPSHPNSSPLSWWRNAGQVTTDSRIMVLLKHVADIGGSGRIGKHRGFEI